MKNETARREIESLDYYLQNHTKDYSEESHTAMMMAIDALSSSEKPNKWIPVSERLPEDAQEVLYSTKTGRVFHGEYYDDNTDRKWFSYKDDMFSFNNVVNAWMPLPEPYEPQGGMKPAEFVEASLNTSLCAEIKIWIDKLYLLFKTDRQKFITLCNEVVGRGSSKTNIVYYLPIIFDQYQKEDSE